MRSRTPKVLHPLLGRPMLAYVLDAARTATGRRPLVVYSPAAERVSEVFADDADFALQDEPRGTADAVRAALDVLPDDVAEVLVLSGDVPLVEADLLHELVEARRLGGAAMTLVAADTFEPDGLGRVVRTPKGDVARIVEEKDATDHERELSEINVGIYAFDGHWLRRRIRDVEPSPATGELYLTDLVRLARADRRPVTSLDVEDDGRYGGINDRAQLQEAERALRLALLHRLMTAGVTIRDPATTFVEAAVALAPDVVLEPNVNLRGRTRIGEGTVVGPNAEVVDSVVGRDCRIWASVVESSEIEDEARIGPFSHLRPGSSIGRGVRIGNYAEVKNSRLEPGVMQNHMSYLGDADVGAGTNIGAGTITANWDGRTKHRTRIGARAFVGVDTMLVAPVEVGDGAKTGAGAVVTRDVPPGKLAVGVPARLRDPRPRPDEGGHGG